MYRKVNKVIIFSVLVVIVLGWLLINKSPQTQATPVISETSPEVFLTAEPIPLEVSGVIVAADRAVLSARTAGVVAQMYALEGTVVQHGQLLISQSTPIADANHALTDAQSTLLNTQQLSVFDTKKTSEQKAELEEENAARIAQLRAASGDSRTNESVDSLIIILESTVTNTLTAIDFIDDNKSFFGSDVVELYHQTIYDLYGRIPNHFTASFRSPTHTDTSIKKLLESISFTEVNNASEVFEIAYLLQGQLELLNKIFESAESDIFDGTDSSNESIYTHYISERTSLTETATALSLAISSLQTIIDSWVEDTVTQDHQVIVLGVDKDAAVRQTNYEERITQATQVVTRAQQSVVAAQQTLGNIYAPFEGMVTRTHIERGEYAQPGQPLLTLTGNTAREVEVRIPTEFAQSITLGHPFTINNKIVGHVDRVSTFSNGGAITAFITLQGDAWQSGESITGTLQTDTPDAIYKIPRAYLYFDTNGPFITLYDKATQPVSVLYDTGQWLYIKTDPSDQALIPAYSIHIK